MIRRDPFADPDALIRRLYAYVAYRIGPGALAEDVVSESVERALRYRETFDPRKGTPEAWAVGIASRVIADASRVREVPLDDVPDSPIDDFAGSSVRKIELTQAMRKLDARSRELLALRYGADLKARDIASLMEMQTNAVEVALSRALVRLRLVLEGGEEAAQHSSNPNG